MIEHQPITIYWDSSCCIDENTLAGLKETGFRPVPMSLSEIITSLQETPTEKGPKVVCLNNETAAAIRVFYSEGQGSNWTKDVFDS